MCFVIQELDLFLQSSKRTLPDFCRDLAATLLIGKALPILIAALIEAHSRAEFLRSRCDVNTTRHMPSHADIALSHANQKGLHACLPDREACKMLPCIA